MGGCLRNGWGIESFRMSARCCGPGQSMRDVRASGEGSSPGTNRRRDPIHAQRGGRAGRRSRGRDGGTSALVRRVACGRRAFWVRVACVWRAVSGACGVRSACVRRAVSGALRMPRPQGGYAAFLRCLDGVGSGPDAQREGNSWAVLASSGLRACGGSAVGMGATAVSAVGLRRDCARWRCVAFAGRRRRRRPVSCVMATVRAAVRLRFRAGISCCRLDVVAGAAAGLVALSLRRGCDVAGE